MHAFRDNAANLLIATPPAARGLDLPEVALVVNLGAPVDSVDYLHRAGRAGRVGSTTPGEGLMCTFLVLLKDPIVRRDGCDCVHMLVWYRIASRIGDITAVFLVLLCVRFKTSLTRSALFMGYYAMQYVCDVLATVAPPGAVDCRPHGADQTCLRENKQAHRLVVSFFISIWLVAKMRDWVKSEADQWSS